MSVRDDGWTEEQAAGLLESLGLEGGIPDWDAKHLEKLRNWCSAHQKDWTTLDGQLEFVAHELCHSYERIGAELKQSETVQQAKKAVEPFVKVIRAPILSRGPRLPR
jgi:hypothetical protein